MDIISCPQCAKKLQVEESARGRRVRCPFCQNAISVPVLERVALELPPQEPQHLAPAPPSPPPASEAVVPQGAVPELSSPLERDQPQDWGREKAKEFEDKQSPFDFGPARRLVRNPVRLVWLALGINFLIVLVYLYNLYTATVAGGQMAVFWGGMVFLLVFVAPPVILEYLGAQALRKFRARGLVWTGAIMAFLLAGLAMWAAALLWTAVTIVSQRGGAIPEFAYRNLLLYAAGALANFLGGLVTLMALVNRKVKRAFAEKASRSSRWSPPRSGEGRAGMSGEVAFASKPATPPGRFPVVLSIAVVSGVFLLLAVVVGIVLLVFTPRPSGEEVGQKHPADFQRIGKASPDKKPADHIQFTKGEFQTQITPDPRHVGEFRKQFQFHGQEGRVYWVKTEENSWADVSVDETEGMVRKENVHSSHRLEVAFLAARSGTYTVVVKISPLAFQPCILRIREMDGTQPLPEELRLKTTNAPLPALTLEKGYLTNPQGYYAAAFAPDGKYFWTATGDTTRTTLLSYWVDFRKAPVGSYKIQGRLFPFAVDKNGWLYAQRDRSSLSADDRSASDLLIWKDLKPVATTNTFPEPSRVLPLQGIVRRMWPSADGRWLYFLDLHSAKLGRLDTTTAAIDKIIDVSQGTLSFCLTPNGKKIYCCAASNSLNIIDVAKFQIERTVYLEPVQPTDVAATNEGLVFLVGKNTGKGLLGNNLHSANSKTGFPLNYISPCKVTIPYVVF